MTKIIDSKWRTNVKRLPILRDHYKNLHFWQNDNKRYIIVSKKTRFFYKTVLHIGRNYIIVLNEEYYDIAMEIANLFDICEVELVFISDLEEKNK